MHSNVRPRHIAFLFIVLYLISISVSGIVSASASGIAQHVKISPLSSHTSGDDAFLSTPYEKLKESAGSSFTLNFTAKNTGTTPWGSGYDIQCTSIGPDCPVPACDCEGINGTVPSGQKCSFTVLLQAPTIPQQYTFTWSMTNNGIQFGNKVLVTVNVFVPPAPTNAPTSTATNVPPTPTPVPTQPPTPISTSTVSATQQATPEPSQPGKVSSTLTLKSPQMVITGQAGQSITFTLTFTNNTSQTLSNEDGSVLKCTNECNKAQVKPEKWQTKPHLQQIFAITLIAPTSPGTYFLTWIMTNSKNSIIAHTSVKIIVTEKQLIRSSKRSIPPVSLHYVTTLNVWIVAGGGCAFFAFLLYLLPVGVPNGLLLYRVLELFLPTTLLRHKR